MSDKKIKYSEDELNQLKEVFQGFDEDGNGYIDKEELLKGLKKLNIPATKEDVEEMINEADENSDGQLSIEEFIQIMANQEE